MLIYSLNSGVSLSYLKLYKMSGLKTVRKIYANFSTASRYRQNFINAIIGADESREHQQTHQTFVDDWDSAVPYSQIPGPKPLPILGNTWRFIPYVGDFQIEHIDKISKNLHETYGKVVKMEGLLGRPDMLFLFDPDEIQKVFRREDALPLRPSMPSLDYYKHVYRKEFFGDNGGVIAVHGEKWQNFRSKVNQIMLQPRIVQMYVKAISATSQEFVDRIKLLRDENDEMPDDFLNEIHKWSLESIARIALDVRLGCLQPSADPETQKLIDAVNTFFMNVPVLELKVPFWKLWSTPTFKKYIQALDTIREITMKHVQVAMENLDREGKEASVLQRVLRMDNDTSTAANLALDMFLVGIDTTSNAVASILYQLALHQDKQDLMREELSRTMPDPCLMTSPSLTQAQLDDMPYLKACVKETMRMYPVVIGNGRCTTSDCVIGGYRVPKGIQVIFQHYVISNLDEYFPKSREFVPERWLAKSREHHAFASLPFGFGKRMCLGRRFADLEIHTVIAKVLKTFKVEYHHRKLDYHIHPMYTPDGPLKLKFTEI